MENYIAINALVYGLVTHTEKSSAFDLFDKSLDASFILYFLATRTMIFGAKLPEDLSVLAKNDDVTFFGSLILKYRQIIPINMHQVRYRLYTFYIILYSILFYIMLIFLYVQFIFASFSDDLFQ